MKIMTKQFLSPNLLEIVIALLLVWILGQNISFQNKIEAKTSKNEDRIIFLEWAFITNPNTPQWQKDQFLHPSRSGDSEPYEFSKNPIK